MSRRPPPLHVTSLGQEPLLTLPTVYVAPGGAGIASGTLPVLQGVVEGLPEALDGLLVAGDLQGHEPGEEGRLRGRLLGHGLAEAIDALCDAGDAPYQLRLGVVLTGDLWADPALMSRGGLGDVDSVWASFVERFRWAVGVAGNHDRFDGRCDAKSALESFGRNAQVLDGDLVEMDGLTVAGISGIVGTKNKPWRVHPDHWRQTAQRLLGRRPQLFVLHQGPDHPPRGWVGDAMIREVLASCKEEPPLVCFGHCQWPETMAVVEGGQAQLLNVDHRALLLTRPREQWRRPEASAAQAQ